MADIRINALATTAASTASDDFIAVDGSANGTRKLNAYSPTFGGNLTVSGTGTFSGAINANADGTNIVFKAFGTTPQSALWTNNDGTMTWGDYATGTKSIKLNTTNGNATVGGNLTVNGTGTNYFVGDITSTATGNNQWQITKGAATNYATLAFSETTSGAAWAIGQRTTAAAGGANRFSFYGSGVGGDAMQITYLGNLLIGTTTDSANGKLQLATHTTSAGGIGFGTDVALFHRATGVGLTLSSVGSTTPYFTLDANGTNVLDVFGLSSDVYFDQKVAGKSLFFRTNGATLALTLDSSQNATFAGAVTVSGADKVLTVTSSASTPGFTMRQTGGIAANRNWGIVINNSANGDFILRRSTTTSGDPTTAVLTFDSTGNATFAGTVSVSNTITTTGSNAALFFNSRTGANSNYAWYSPDGTVARLYDNTNSKTLVDFAANTGDATFAGTIATQNGTASTPASASATGTAGTIKWDASYIYVCTATNTWKRVAIATW